MTISKFTKMSPSSQMDFLKQQSTFIHRIIKGNVIVSLYWSKDFIFEVFSPKSREDKYEIKCYDRFDYVQS